MTSGPSLNQESRSDPPQLPLTSCLVDSEPKPTQADRSPRCVAFRRESHDAKNGMFYVALEAAVTSDQAGKNPTVKT